MRLIRCKRVQTLDDGSQRVANREYPNLRSLGETAFVMRMNNINRCHTIPPRHFPDHMECSEECVRRQHKRWDDLYDKNDLTVPIHCQGFKYVNQSPVSYQETECYLEGYSKHDVDIILNIASFYDHIQQKRDREGWRVDNANWR